MKKTIINTALVVVIALGAVSCNDANKEAKTSEAKEAAEATQEAVNYTVNTDASTIKWKGEKPTGTHYGTVDLADGSSLSKRK